MDTCAPEPQQNRSILRNATDATNMHCYTGLFYIGQLAEQNILKHGRPYSYRGAGWNRGTCDIVVECS